MALLLSAFSVPYVSYATSTGPSVPPDSSTSGSSCVNRTTRWVSVSPRPSADALVVSWSLQSRRGLRQGLLQVLDDGRLTDSQGRTVDCRNAIFILTSNIGSRHIAEQAGFGLTEGVREAVMTDLRGHFRPEFLNRIDEVVLFRPLGEAEVATIAGLLLRGLNTRLATKRIRLELTPEALAWIAARGFDIVYGARPLRRFLQRELETPLARDLLGGKIPDGSLVRVRRDKEALAFEVVSGGFSD
jgi:ATP-dependent Clp protease ATP-binding subunit ClpA